MLRKKIIATVIATSCIISISSPAYADTKSLSQRYQDAVASSKANVTQNYEISVENSIFNVNQTIKAIEDMKASGTITQSILTQLATEITELNKAVNVSGNEASTEVINLILKAENTVSDLKGTGAIKAQSAIAVAKQSLGINSTTATVKAENVKAATGVVNLTDISTHWAKSNIQKLISLNAVSGYPDGTFKPNNTITRAEFLKLCLLAVDNTIDTSYEQGSPWASGILQAAYDKGIVSDTEIQMTNESLNKNITRYEMAKIMVKVNEIMQGEAKVDVTGVQNVMSDYNSLPQNYKIFVSQAFMKGLLSGYSDSSFQGLRTGTRAEATTMVLRLLDQSSRVTVDTTKTTAPTSIATQDGALIQSEVQKYCYQAFSTAKIYQSNGKYYVSVNLPTIPSNYIWLPTILCTTKDGSNIYNTVDRNVVGSTGNKVFEVSGLTAAQVQAGASISFTLKVIQSNGNRAVTGYYRVSTGMANQIYEVTNDGFTANWISYNTSSIFNDADWVNFGN